MQDEEAYEKAMSQQASEAADFFDLIERYPLADNEPKEEAKWQKQSS